jgi:ABC-2 type transport system permease protein
VIARFLLRAWLGSVGGQSEFRFNHIVGLIAAVLNAVLSVATIEVLYRRGVGFPGWTIDASLLVLGLFSVTTGILRVFLWPNLPTIVHHVATGTLDFVLLKPIDSQLQLSFSSISPWSAMEILAGIGMVIYACLKIQPPITDVMLALVPLSLGLVIIYSIFFAFATMSIWFVQVGQASYILNSIIDAARYPKSAYPAAYRVVLTYILPVTFLTSVPAEAVIGRIDVSTLIGGGICAIVSLWLSRLFWKRALRSYTGASG